MAWEQRGFAESTRLAGVDLSDNQFKFVKLAADGTLVKIAAATDVPYGVQQNEPIAGDAVEVVRDGVSKLVGAANLAAGDFVGTTSAGIATKLTIGTDTTKYVAGNVVDGNGAANSIASVAVDCLVPHRAA
jgi:hypothetical protein